MLFFLLIDVKMPTIDGIFTFMSRNYFMLSLVEHEKIFITSGPDHAKSISLSKRTLNAKFQVAHKPNIKAFG